MMSKRRATRRQLCAWIAGALLLMQWLVLAQACPTMSQPTVAATHAEHCQEGDALLDAALCKAHCSSEQPALKVVGLHHLPPLLAGQFFLLEPVDPLRAEPIPGEPPRAGAPPGWPPIYLTHGVLRN